MESLTFDSSDVGLVEATVSKLYSKMHIDAVGSCTRTQITGRVVARELGFDDLDYSFDISYSAEAQGLMITCEVLSNTIRRVGEGYDETFGPGDPFLISRPDHPYSGVAYAPRLRFTVLDPAFLARAVATASDDVASPVRMLDHHPVSRQTALHPQRSIASVRDSMMAVPETARGPLMVSAASQYLAASVRYAFPNSANSDATAEDRRDAHPATLRRAVAFSDEHAHEDITIADTAAAAFVSIRGLQLASRRHLDSTPLAYLRRVRLAHAHRQLRSADPARETVAYRWGFSNPSRFTAYYRRAYGTVPSQTLYK